MRNVYSTDLRIRAVNMVKKGEKITHVSKIFEISRNTLYRWLKQKKEVGHVEQREWNRGRKSKIVDLAEFAIFVNNNKEKTLTELAELRGNISRCAIWRGLKKIGYGKKKRPSVIKKGTR